jgi:nucleotide-binding universal stress UspA family protein
MDNIQRILWPTDFSDQSKRALPLVNGLARRFGAHVQVVHVLPDPPPMAATPGHGAAGMTGYLDSMNEHAQERLDELLDTGIADDVDATALVRPGSPAHQIAEVAETEGIDLIILATHGATGFKRLVVGSVAEKVVRLAPCPVLSVPPTPEDS